MDGALTIEIPARCERDDGPTLTKPFVVGPENQLLLPPLQRLLDPVRHDRDADSNAGASFNPFVLVGTSGSGKSTLLRAIVRCWARAFGPDVVRYSSVVDFGRDVQTAHSDREINQWRESLHHARLLAIDDLQRVRQRATVQAALRIVVDSIVERGGLVVVASQTLPASLLQLDVGLRDRLSAGLTVQIHWPGEAARKELLCSAAKQKSVAIDMADLSRLADTLEGSAARIVGALAQLDGVIGKTSSSEKLTTNRIATVVARYLGVMKADILGKSRKKSLVYARSVVAHLARRYTDASYARIGSQLGGRDHTTIMHADRSIAEQATRDPATQQTLEELGRILRSH